jgi:hypothetical protein
MFNEFLYLGVAQPFALDIDLAAFAIPRLFLDSRLRNAACLYVPYTPRYVRRTPQLLVAQRLSPAFPVIRVAVIPLKLMRRGT